MQGEGSIQRVVPWVKIERKSRVIEEPKKDGRLNPNGKHICVCVFDINFLLPFSFRTTGTISMGQQDDWEKKFCWIKDTPKI